MKTVLVIGDTHIPFEEPGYLAFCKRIEKAFKCTEVVHIGDLVDNHSISYHEHNPNGWSAEDEIEESVKRCKKWYKAFPKVKICRGNHDMLVDRKGRTAGLPERAFKQFRDIWELPKGWIDDWEFFIDGVKYQHGTGFSGKYGHVSAATSNLCSTVIGHLHSTAGVEYMANNERLIFAMSVGCGIDRKAYAFAYGKDFRRKPILGCGVVSYAKRGVNAQFIPMLLT
jgi:predicted phosphodiesterase